MFRLPAIPLPTSTDELLLLPNPHAARLWRSEAGESFFSPGSQLLAWSEWTTALWDGLLAEGHEDRVLLNRLQEEQLWGDIVRDDAAAAIVPAAIPELARLARSALQAAAAHRILPRLRAAADTPDARTLSVWVTHFVDRCATERLIPQALLEEALAEHLAAGRLRAPALLRQVGAAPATPAAAYLLRRLEEAGTHVEPFAPAASDAQRLACLLPTEEDELRFAVRLVVQRARHQGAQTFALILPDAERQRSLLEPLLRELVAPELGSVFADLSAMPWYFSARPALRSAPIVATALDALRWLIEPLASERAEALFLSPHTSLAADGSGVRSFRKRFLSGGALRPDLELEACLKALQASAPVALRRFREQAERLRMLTARRAAADWADQVRRLLQTLGWAEARPLSPLEFQTREAWEALLDRLATLGLQNRRFDLRAFLDLLSAEATAQAIPALQPAAPVQILSLEETAGLHFDVAVVLGVSEASLPLTQGRHPLLPQRLQAELGMGDATRDMERTANLLEDLTRRCGSVVLLASPAEGHTEVKLTPLAALLGFETQPPASLLPLEELQSEVTLEITHDQAQLPPLASPKVGRGAEVLGLQAACGFRAFAAVRLGATNLETTGLGLDARGSGSALHAALEAIWKELGSQERLKALSLDDRRMLIRSAVDSVLERWRHRPDAQDAWTREYLLVLQTRFMGLLIRWLEQEAARAPFRIYAQEQAIPLALGGLELSLRPDRIDEVEGGLVLVDYKTSYGLSPGDWLDERPDAPQLPAYALALGEPGQVRGIAFAQIRPGRDQGGWISLADREALFPRGRQSRLTDLEPQLESWRKELLALAEAFARGEASLAPKRYPQTCKFCGLRPLCRLNPNALLAQPAGEAMEEEESAHG